MKRFMVFAVVLALLVLVPSVGAKTKEDKSEACKDRVVRQMLDLLPKQHNPNKVTCKDFMLVTDVEKEFAGTLRPDQVEKLKTLAVFVINHGDGRGDVPPVYVNTQSRMYRDSADQLLRQMVTFVPYLLTAVGAHEACHLAPQNGDEEACYGRELEVLQYFDKQGVFGQWPRFDYGQYRRSVEAARDEESKKALAAGDR